MNARQWADRLNGRDYLHEVEAGEQTEMQRDGVVVMFGQSDDLLEMRGAVDDEVSAWNGTSVFFTKGGMVVSKCNDERCPYHEEEKKAAAKVSVSAIPWKFTTDIPHEKFHIVEDGEIYGEGIVFRLADVPESKP